MDLAPTPSISWYQRIPRAASWAVNGIGSAVSKTAQAWSSMPKALKIPVEAAVIVYASGGNEQLKAGLAAATLCFETPKNLAGFLTNQPANLFGMRWQLFDIHSQQNPKAPLTELDKKIGKFERAQPLIHSVVASNLLPSPVDLGPPSEALEDYAKTTDAKLEILSEKISYFSILKAMHLIAGIEEADTAPLLSLVDEASRPNSSSIWQLFKSRYSDKISRWGKLKAGFIYLFLWHWIPIIPKTVDTYMKNMLSEMRINLKEKGENRKKFINGLVEDIDNFLEVYNGAAETYAYDDARKSNLNHYRKNAMDRMLPKDAKNEGKSPEELRWDLCRKLSASFVDNFAPKVPFGFFEGWLNERIKNQLRETILPGVFLQVTDGGKEAAKKHNIPFYLALTKTLTAQVAKMQGKLEQEHSDPSSIAGIKNFEAIVKKFLRAIDLADCKTPQEVKKKIEELNMPESRIDAELRHGIQDGMQKGLAVLFEYLSKQENTEELFANLFASIALPLSGHLPMNDRQWAEIAIEYEGSKILLKESVSALAHQIVQEAVQDTVRGGSSPEAVEKSAQKIFAEHKAHGQASSAELIAASNTIREKIKQSKDFGVDEKNSIHPELGGITGILKAFENKERVKISMDHDPLPQIAQLPSADQESILRALYPLYEGSNQIMDLVLRLQELQKQHQAQSQRAWELAQVRQIIEELSKERATVDQIERLSALMEKIETMQPAPKRLKVSVESMTKSIKQFSDQQKALDALAALQPFPGSGNDKPGLIDELLHCIEGNPLLGFKKWKCLDGIRAKVQIAFPAQDDQERVLQLIERLNKYNSLPDPLPNFDKEIWKPLGKILNEQKTCIEWNQKRTASYLEKIVPQAHYFSIREQETTDRVKEQCWEAMRDQGERLQNDALKLNRLAKDAKKEIYLRFTSEQLGQIGGTLGFLLGLASGTVVPESGAVMGAFAGTSLANLGNLVKGKWLHFATTVLGASAAAGFAVNRLAQQTSPLAAAMISAAGCSAGMEYVGSQMTTRAIDVGVDVAIPKVTEVFDKAYEHLLTNDIVINGGIKIAMKQVVDLFPPKK